jgi:hypothetical protein
VLRMRRVRRASGYCIAHLSRSSVDKLDEFKKKEWMITAVWRLNFPPPI